MCGIIGITGKREVAPLILGSLKHLEYRGYDSAGIATVTATGIELARAEGKLINLARRLEAEPLAGFCGIGHTRWATHGLPNETNAHPHATTKVAVVHNGIIENFRELRQELTALGQTFKSQTDTEVVPLLANHFLEQGMTPEAAVEATLKRLKGAYALAFLFAHRPGLLIAARQGSPLAIGHGVSEMFLGSDAIALSYLTGRVSYLEDGDWALLTPDGLTIHDARGERVNRNITSTGYDGSSVGKGHYRHYMQKEIQEQPSVVGEALKVYCNPTSREVSLGDLPFALADVKRVQLIACGTSYYAAMVAKSWLESIARVPTDVDVASEYRYREPILETGTLTIVISQSGETADTLAALRYARRALDVVAVVNVPESTIAREASAVLHTYAGPEIGVASTKAFSTQLATLGCFTIALAEAREAIDSERREELCQLLLDLPAKMSEVLIQVKARVQALATQIFHCRDMLYIGRGTSYAMALEGALKMKEISYIHAEGYPAGELKHGPIALIDEDVPVIVLAPYDHLFDKTTSNLQEAAARGGRIILISDAQGIEEASEHAIATIAMPRTDPFVTPMLYALPMQMLAYHVAVLKGTDVDQPRNLAKSVTVE